MDSQDNSLRLDVQFRNQALRTPDRIALHYRGKAATFAELHEDSDCLASALRSRGVPDGGFVGVHMERSLDYVISVLAILKLNCAVVPLPPSYPAARLRDILAFSSLDAVIHDGPAPPPSFPPTRVIRFTELAGAPTGEALSVVGSSEMPAFVLCSSGSTGKPKMIVRSHQSFFHRLHWTWDNHPYAPNEVCCQKSHMTTTHAIYELFEPLLRGVPTHIISDQEVRALESFWDTINARGITRLLIVPSTLQASLDIPGFVAPPIRVLVLMGEYVHSQLVERTIGAFPAQTKLFSIYGSTEASSTIVCDLRASYRAGEELPLGTPISPEVRALVLDAQLKPVPPGEVGLLHIAGSPLFSGYYRDPELTAAVLVTDPVTQMRLYDSHDQVRVMPNGDLQFVGRVDHTVKIRGFRVDLQEVERAIRSAPGISQCAVIPNEVEPGQSILLAFAAPGSLDPAKLLQSLRAQLPAYMVPSTVIALDALPITPSGKVDRQRLLDDHAKRHGMSHAAAPRTDTELKVLEVWQQVLKHRDIAPGASFFEVGGTSLTVFAVVHRLRVAFGLNRSALPDHLIYQLPTVEALASYIDGGRRGATAPTPAPASVLVSLKRAQDPNLPPLFVISSAGGTLGAYEKLVRALNTRREVLGVRDPFIWGDRDPGLGFSHWISRFLSAIRERQPHGPYYIAAYSSAGAFGYEIARRLRLDGEPVALLTLIDPLAMDRATKRRYGYWAMEARFMRRSKARLVILAGWLRSALPLRLLASEPVHGTDDTAQAAEQFLLAKDDVRTNWGYIRQLSVLLELNSGLHFALTEAELSRVDPGGYLDVLLKRVREITPDVDVETIRNIAIQYELQVRSQHAYRLRPYDGRVVIFEPAGPHNGVLAAQFRPYVEDMRWRALELGTPSDRIEALAEIFPVRIRSHYLCMRDDVFVESLANELGKLLS